MQCMTPYLIYFEARVTAEETKQGHQADEDSKQLLGCAARSILRY